ncbi:amiloride-sensitive sodium channel subunit alpha [Protopterus annectens]|uniref:amiloride-sensitive sodium channel subunit alpha n=1 Tax=Protopterus annectens TaxID=7888 RepID=UPI001CF9E478|nr:amiloride-sensitive sodium channel subunit alpha [Protopterus annectens]XP_043935497.1 amiloride-sensitive sodium channel subunit alpha [Protopterus annectens]
MSNKEENAENGKKKEGLFEFYDSFQELFEFFCINTTIHGTIRMVCSKHNNMKTAFWTILFIATFGIMYWQFGLLLDQYYSFPVSITMAVNYDKLVFPAVTVCTLNPYRYNAVSTELANLDCYTEQLLSTLYHYTPANSNQSACNNTSNKQDSNNKYIPLEFLTYNDTQSGYPFKGTTNGSSSFNNSEFYRVGFKVCNDTDGDCFYQIYSSGVDALREWYKYQYVNIMGNAPLSTYQEDNPQISNFVYACEFNKISCGSGNYTQFNHPQYGSCYTFNDGDDNNPWISFSPGVESGLSLVLRTEQNDFLPYLSNVAGARVMVHDQNQPVFMEDSGFDIRPGVETSIGIKKEIISRLGGVYGNCTADGSDINVENLYNSDYTQQACIRSCFQATIVERCGCGYYFYPLPAGATYCTNTKHRGWGYCYYKLYKAFAADELGCFKRCPKPCIVAEYVKTAGYSKWPSSSSETWIAKVLSQESPYSTSARKVIAKLNIYFYELSYKTTGESPSFNVVTLLSNMGSQWSLWFGSSVLSVVEMGELVIDLIAVGIIVLRRRQREKTKATDDTEDNSPSETYVHPRQENSDNEHRERAPNRIEVVAEISPPPAYDSLALDTPVACSADCSCTRRMSQTSIKSHTSGSSNTEEATAEGPTAL